MRKIHRDNEDIIDEESSDNDNYFLYNIKSSNIYPNDHPSNMIKANLKNQHQTNTENVITNFVTLGKNLDDSLEVDHEAMTDKEDNKNISLSRSFQEYNKKRVAPQNIKNDNNNMIELKKLKGRLTKSVNRFDVDEELENELRVKALKRNISMNTSENTPNTFRNNKKEENPKYAHERDDREVSLNGNRKLFILT